MDCEYIDVDDILINTITENVYYRKLQERLLDKGEELILSKALAIVKQYKLSQQHMKIVRDEDPHVSAIRPKTKKRKNRGKEENQLKRKLVKAMLSM